MNVSTKQNFATPTKQSLDSPLFTVSRCTWGAPASWGHGTTRMRGKPWRPCVFLPFRAVQCELGEPQISVDTHWGHMNQSGWVKSTTTLSDPELLWGLCVTFFTSVGAGPGAPLGGCHHTLVSCRHCTVSSAAIGAPHSPHGPGAGSLDPAHAGRITCSYNRCSLFHRSVHSSVHDVNVSDIWVHTDVLEARRIFILVCVAANRTQKRRNGGQLQARWLRVGASVRFSCTSLLEKPRPEQDMAPADRWCKERAACPSQNGCSLRLPLTEDEKPRGHWRQLSQGEVISFITDQKNKDRHR